MPFDEEIILLPVAVGTQKFRVYEDYYDAIIAVRNENIVYGCLEHRPARAVKGTDGGIGEHLSNNSA
jgi:hypothetical protein